MAWKANYIDAHSTERILEERGDFIFLNKGDEILINGLLFLVVRVVHNVTEREMYAYLKRTN